MHTCILKELEIVIIYALDVFLNCFLVILSSFHCITGFFTCIIFNVYFTFHYIDMP